MTSLVARLALAVGALSLCLSFTLPSTVRAQEYDGIDAEYTEIGQQGIIFANICEGPAPEDGVDTCECRASGKCSLEDVLQVFVNISYFILGISGTVLLFVFMYGGFNWIYSRGNPKYIERGKETMVGGVIGLVIIFGAYVIINFIIGGLKQGEAPTGNLENTIEDPAQGDGNSGIEGAGDIINSN